MKMPSNVSFNLPYEISNLSHGDMSTLPVLYQSCKILWLFFFPACTHNLNI